MKYFIYPLLLVTNLLLTGCAEDQVTLAADPRPPTADTLLRIPPVVVSDSALVYVNQRSLWYRGDTLYSGYGTGVHANGQPATRTGFWRGRKQGPATRWRTDGQLLEIANFERGRLHGEKKRWTATGEHQLLDHLQYQHGKAHGEQRKWYPTGELYKILHLTQGREEGLQQGYRQNGALYANYEARDGRIYGLKKASLCYGLVDETLKRDR